MFNNFEIAKEIVERLLKDLDDRKYYSLSNVNDDIMNEWKLSWINKVMDILDYKL